MLWVLVQLGGQKGNREKLDLWLEILENEENLTTACKTTTNTKKESKSNKFTADLNVREGLAQKDGCNPQNFLVASTH